MNFAVDGTHREFFRKNRWIEFEGLFSSPRLATLEKEIETLLAERLKTNHPGKAGWSDYAEFMAGRDVWRSSQLLKKHLLGKNFAEIASEIIEHKPLRIGYDQLFPISQHGLKGSNAYVDLLHKTPTLQEISPIQGVLCGLMICLKSAPLVALPAVATDEALTSPTTIFSQVAGNGVIFAPDHPIPFHELVRAPGATYLLIVYVNAKSVYTHLEGVCHSNDFRKLGYNFGDRLTDVLNPIVYP